MSGAGCRAFWPLLDAKERFLALELTCLHPVFPSEVFPGAVQLASSAEAAAGGRHDNCATPTHGSAARRAKPHHPGRLLLPLLSLPLSTSRQIPIDFYSVYHMMHISILEMLRLLL